MSCLGNNGTLRNRQLRRRSSRLSCLSKRILFSSGVVATCPVLLPLLPLRILLRQPSLHLCLRTLELGGVVGRCPGSYRAENETKLNDRN